MFISATAGSTYVFPFGISSAVSDYIPLTFINQQTASTYNITVSTRATPASDNLPLATGTNMNSVYGGSANTVVDRWYDISSSVNPLASPGADITFSYKGSENTLTPVGLQTGTLKVQHWDAAAATPVWETPFTGGSAGVTGTSVGTVSVTGATKFSPFIIVAATAPLPIELLDFNATRRDEKYVELKWSTSSETNNDYFTIERSFDGKTFNAITFIDGKGTCTKTSTYESIDETPLEGIYYYRLKQTDFDGKHTYSKVISIAATDSNVPEFSVYPNPINTFDGNNILFSLAGLQAELPTLVVLYDILGKEHYSKIIIADTDGNVKIALESSQRLANGTYMIRASNNNKLFSKKILVQ